jgi:NAD(P)-dependent dehydrogenase (short-subunit alcohol dehydrogenase family)
LVRVLVVEHQLGLLNKDRGAPYDDYPEMAWDKLMALNVKSIFYMTVGLESLLLNGTNNDMPSRVINISSMAGIGTGDVTTGDDGGLSAPGSGTFSYGPSKAACIHLSRMQSSKLAPKNIMVNCVCPGVFPSRMTNFGMDKCESVLRSRSVALKMF